MEPSPSFLSLLRSSSLSHGLFCFHPRSTRGLFPSLPWGLQGSQVFPQGLGCVCVCACVHVHVCAPVCVHVSSPFPPSHQALAVPTPFIGCFCGFETLISDSLGAMSGEAGEWDSLEVSSAAAH